MSKVQYYIQCELQKRIESGIMHDIAWIPEKFAIIGKQVRIKREDGIWDHGWIIAKTYSRLEDTKVESCERSYLKQRGVSDI